MTTHTPGPWEIVNCQKTGKFYHAGANHVIWHTKDNRQTQMPIASISCNRTDNQFDANARLIIAAPDMLKELKWAADTYDTLAKYMDEGSSRDVCTRSADKARAVIAKAEAKP